LKQKVLRSTNCQFSFDRTRTAQTSTILPCHVNAFTELLRSNDRGIERHADTRIQQFYYCYVYPLSQEICLPHRCLETIARNHMQIYGKDLFMLKIY
jgi:hypothetical protein